MQKKYNYSELLKDPRWQKKRLKILERDGWKCRSCLTAETTLNVHHIFYLSKIAPWDIPDGLLITFCEDCHNPKPCEGYDSCEKCPEFGMDTNKCTGYSNPPVELVSWIANLLDTMLVTQKKEDIFTILQNLIIGQELEKNG